MPLLGRSTQLLIALVICFAAACKKHESPPSGDILETLRAPTVSGATFDPHTLRGKPTVLMFVSPTCPHCVAELPEAQKAAHENDANLVAVFIVGKAENAKGVLEHVKFDGTALVDDGTLRRRYGIRSVPYTLVLGGDGRARELFHGEQGHSVLSDALADAR